MVPGDVRGQRVFWLVVGFEPWFGLLLDGWPWVPFGTALGLNFLLFRSWPRACAQEALDRQTSPSFLRARNHLRGRRGLSFAPSPAVTPVMSAYKC